MKRNRELVAKNLPVLSHFFAEHPRLFEWSVPDGGCIGYPKYLGDDGVEEFAKQLVEQAGELFAESSFFRSVSYIRCLNGTKEADAGAGRRFVAVHRSQEMLCV